MIKMGEEIMVDRVCDNCGKQFYVGDFYCMAGDDTLCEPCREKIYPDPIWDEMCETDEGGNDDCYGTEFSEGD